MWRFALHSAPLAFSMCLVALTAGGCAAEDKSKTDEAKSAGQADPTAAETETFALSLTCVTPAASVPKRSISVSRAGEGPITVQRTEDGLGIDATVDSGDADSLQAALKSEGFDAFIKAQPEDTQSPPAQTDCSLALSSAGKSVNKQYSNRQLFEGDAEKGRKAMHRALAELERVLLSKNQDPGLDPRGDEADPVPPSTPPT